MNSLLATASRRYLSQHPWQLALAVVGIMLGVAVVIAVDLAMDNSLNTFARAAKAVSGSATHRIVSDSGVIDENLYTQLRVKLGLKNASPLVHGNVNFNSNQTTSRIRIYGIDPFIEDKFSSVWQAPQDKLNSLEFLLRLLVNPNSILLSEQTARDLQLGRDDDFTIDTVKGKQRLSVVGILRPQNPLTQQAIENLLITDIATAQEVLGMIGQLSAIDLILPSGDQAVVHLNQIRQMLPADVSLVAAEARVKSMQQMTKAFAINLQAMGLLSLLIGMFLIYNTMTFLVVQRRPLIARLRTLGVTRKQIFYLVLAEACLLALLGSSIGIIVGIFLGHGLLQLVSETINVIYFQLHANTYVITPEQVIKGAALGIVVTLVACVIPAWEATKATPQAALSRAQLEAGARGIANFAGIAGMVLLGIGWALTLESSESIALGLSCVFFLLFGFALLMPISTLWMMKFVESISGFLFGIMGKMPPRMVAAEISRTGIAIAALMVAVAATIGMDLMISSFRQTVEEWLKISLRADLYVSRIQRLAHYDQATISSAHRLKATIKNVSQVQMISSVLYTKLKVDEELTPVIVFELNRKSKDGFILQQQQANIWQRFNRDASVMVTESYAYHHGTQLGDQLAMQTEKGSKFFTVIAIYADYSGDRGHLAMARNNYVNNWQDRGYSGIGIYAQAGTDLQLLKQEIRNLLDDRYRVKSSRAIYQASMQIFEQTFVITQTLRWMAAAIAFVGVLSALMALQLARTRQLGVLRALGMTQTQLAILISTETGLMGLVAGLIAVPVGYIVASVLIFVVYQRSFGWTMAFNMHSEVAFQGVILAVLAAMSAGVYPALKMARTQVAEALRSE